MACCDSTKRPYAIDLAYLTRLANRGLSDARNGDQTSLSEVLADLLLVSVLVLASGSQLGVLNGLQTRGFLVVRGDLLDLLINSRLVSGRHA